METEIKQFKKDRFINELYPNLDVLSKNFKMYYISLLKSRIGTDVDYFTLHSVNTNNKINGLSFYVEPNIDCSDIKYNSKELGKTITLESLTAMKNNVRGSLQLDQCLDNLNYYMRVYDKNLLDRIKQMS